MKQPVQVADDQTTGKHFYALHLDSLDQWPATLARVAPSFGLLLACDADQVPTAVIASAVDKALASGAGYVVAWGPGCEEVHDTFDEAHVLMKLERPHLPVLITTWHADDSLDEALWYFVEVARLPEPSGATDWLAVSVERPDWADQIGQRLANLASLRAIIHADHDELD